MAQYKQNSLKPGKPYRTARLTHANCAIGLEKQAAMYAEWAARSGQKVIHIFPAGKTGYARQFRDHFVKKLGRLSVCLPILDVNPADWS